MPVFRRDEIERRRVDGVCGPAELSKLGNLGGLTQFGVTLETLSRGSRTSIKHWHAEEDELVYVMQGSVTMHEGDSRDTLKVGDVATFRAGVPVGHTFENTGEIPATLLIVGTRSTRDVVTYPDDDRVLHRDGSETRWTDYAGNPASNPY